MEKGIRNADAVTRKLRLALTRAPKNRLDVTKKERRKGEEMIEKWKVKAMVAKRRQASGRISLSSEKEDKSDTGDDINQN